MTASASDFTAAVGLALIAGGLYPIYWPASLLVPGALLFLLALIGAWRRDGYKPPATKGDSQWVS